MVPAWAGKPALPVVEVVPVIALESWEENDIEAPVVDPLEAVVGAAVVVGGVNAADRLESSELIWANRAVTSVMLIVLWEVIDAPARELKRGEASPKARLPSTVPSMDRI
jgi:hypothetical protein